MRRVIVKCGCGATVGTHDVQDGQEKFTTVAYAGECEECTANDGDYYKSKRWKK